MTDYNSAHYGSAIDAAITKAAKLPTISSGDANKKLVVKTDETGFECVDDNEETIGDDLDTLEAAFAAHLVADNPHEIEEGGQITAVQISSRTSSGTWTITGATVGRPIVIGLDPSTGGSGEVSTQLYVSSGSYIGSTASSLHDFILRCSSSIDLATNPSFTIVPTATTITLEVSYHEATLRAYELGVA